MTDENLAQAVNQSDRPVLLYFWANWCGPCRLVSPSVAAIAEEYADNLKTLKLEVDPNPEAVKTYKVEGVPALRLVKDGEVVWFHEGAITKDGLKDQIEHHLGN